MTDLPIVMRPTPWDDEPVECVDDGPFIPATESSACSHCPYEDNTCQIDGCEIYVPLAKELS